MTRIKNKSGVIVTTVTAWGDTGHILVRLLLLYLCRKAEAQTSCCEKDLWQ